MGGDSIAAPGGATRGGLRCCTGSHADGYSQNNCATHGDTDVRKGRPQPVHGTDPNPAIHPHTDPPADAESGAKADSADGYGDQRKSVGLRLQHRRSHL